MGEWNLPVFTGFTEQVNGLLVAVSDVSSFSDSQLKSFVLENLILGLMVDENSFKVVLKDDRPIILPGKQYKHPKFSDRPKGNVIRIRPC